MAEGTRERYRALLPLSYPAGKAGSRSVDIGEIVDDIPAGDIKGYLDHGGIELVKPKPESQKEGS